MIYQKNERKSNNSSWRTEHFEVNVGLHQWSALIPFLFVLVMDALREEIGNEELWELLCADDLVITAKNEGEPTEKVWRVAGVLSERDLKVNADKTEVLVSSRKDGGRIVMQEEDTRL
ncbi:uncharacterized protein LOC135211452 [Macrobrachium nipponense]|uniref:uncharacterized protein LOC135211452 n=1 Tax=Macrobrachium nipponense TaxID=159736 RepID=UPI0030C8B0BE